MHLLHYFSSWREKPRPVSTTLNGENPNKAAHAAFLYTAPAEICNLTFVLIIKDIINPYTWLCPCNNANSDAAATAIGKCKTSFGRMKWLVPD